MPKGEVVPKKCEICVCVCVSGAEGAGGVVSQAKKKLNDRFSSRYNLQWDKQETLKWRSLSYRQVAPQSQNTLADEWLHTLSQVRVNECAI